MELAIPHLRILGYDEAVSFYVGALGFEIAFEWRHEAGFPVFMGIRRGTLYAHLSEHEGSGPPGEGARHDRSRWPTSMGGTRGSSGRGSPSEVRELETQPWGAKDFVVQDPFDNTIVVTSSGSERAARHQPP